MDKNCDNIWGRIAQIWHKTNIVYSYETETARNKKKEKKGPVKLFMVTMSWILRPVKTEAES